MERISCWSGGETRKRAEKISGKLGNSGSEARRLGDAADHGHETALQVRRTDADPALIEWRLLARRSEHRVRSGLRVSAQLRDERAALLGERLTLIHQRDFGLGQLPIAGDLQLREGFHDQTCE